MFKKIMEKIIRKKNQTEEKNICWPCDWNYEQVQNFNAILYGMAMKKMQ